jgi:hypothetical protein
LNDCNNRVIALFHFAGFHEYLATSSTQVEVGGDGVSRVSHGSLTDQPLQGSTSGVTDLLQVSRGFDSLVRRAV